MYKVLSKTQRITTNGTLTPEGYGGWSAVNLGDTPAEVNGQRITANGALIGVDYTHLAPNVEWNEPIRITFEEPAGTNPLVVVTRLKYRYSED